MSAKKFFFLSLLMIVMVLSSMTYALYLSDSYSVAHPQRTRYYGEPNRNFLKVHYILNHPQRYDSFIFGSSKVGALRASTINKGHFYNMTYSAGIPHEHLLNLKLFLRSGIKIKNLLVGLEEASYLEPFAKHQQQGLTKGHPLATGESWFNFYRFYFFHVPSKHDISLFKQQQRGEVPLMRMDVYAQKTYYDNLLKVLRPKDPNDPVFLQPAEFYGDKMTNAIEDIAQIVQLAKVHDINLTVIMNPIHHTTYKAMNLTLFQDFKTKLAAITPYYDFSGPNIYTKNNHYWNDTSHYDFRVGSKILDILYTHATPQENFGTYITKSWP